MDLKKCSDKLINLKRLVNIAHILKSKLHKDSHLFPVNDHKINLVLRIIRL